MQNINNIKILNDKNKNKKKINTKNNEIFKRILIVFVISILLSIANVMFVNKNKIYVNKKAIEINKIKLSIEQLQKEYVDFKVKSTLFEKYNSIWQNKILNKYNLDLNINNVYFSKLYKKYNRIDAIDNFNVKIQNPITIKTNQLNKNIQTLQVKVILTFNAMHNNEIQLFLNYIIENLNTFLIISDINISSLNPIDINFVKSVIKGNFYPLLKTEVHFNSYFVKEDKIIQQDATENSQKLLEATKKEEK